MHDKDLLGEESAHQRKGKGKKIKGGGIHEKKSTGYGKYRLCPGNSLG